MHKTIFGLPWPIVAYLAGFVTLAGLAGLGIGWLAHRYLGSIGQFITGILVPTISVGIPYLIGYRARKREERLRSS
jgi:uncharacterized membrane protein YeaQ/YmgE (transglycosylase-associated protein family)